MMFFKTISGSEFRDNVLDNLTKVSDKSVLQIIEGSQPIRVVMTQEYYLSLLGKIASLESTAGEETVPHKSADELSKEIDAWSKKLKKIRPSCV